MEPLICPDCRGELDAKGGKIADCILHGGRYEILFDRYATVAATADGLGVPVPVQAPRLAEAAAACTTHPRQAAITSCVGCAKPLCSLCVFDVGARSYCSDCAAANAKQAAAETKACPMCNVPNQLTASKCAACGHHFALLRPAETAARPRLVPEGVMCLQHPEVGAVERCRVCGVGVCATCDFTLPGNLHVCPACIEKEPDQEISPKRRSRMMWGLALSVYATIGMLLLLTGTLHRAFSGTAEDDAFNTIVGNAIFIPTVVGTGLSWSAFDRRLRNPMAVWAGAIWNSVLLALYCVLIIIGLSS